MYCVLIATIATILSSLAMHNVCIGANEVLACTLVVMPVSIFRRSNYRR